MTRHSTVHQRDSANERDIDRPDLEARRAIARDPRSGRWYSFTDASATLVAWDLAEVTQIVTAADAAADNGSWVVGFVGYDAGPAFDSAVVSQRDPDVPLAVFAVFDVARPDPLDSGFFTCGRWQNSIDAEDFGRGVDAIKGHISDGDTYQVNLTYRRVADFQGESLGLFRSLMAAQQAPHGIYLDLGPVALCSASPELFWRREPLDDDRALLTSLPMKGTRPRGSSPADDERLAGELLGSAKDRAENTMILDMMRNDFGRIAEVGSVTVPALHTVERYPTVLQMTSTVTAVTRARVPEIFAATFPPASITGAPKYRTTELISRLETTPRGSYTGAAGIITPDGVAEFNVAIRSVWVDRTQGSATYGVGGGIVWDSDRVDEFQEALVKTRVLDRACEPIRLVETMAWQPGVGIHLVERHRARLVRSARALGFAVDPVGLDVLLKSVDATEPRRLRLLIDACGVMELESSAMPEPVTEPWPVRLADTAVASNDPMLRHKTTHRHLYDHHRRTNSDVSDVILWNERSEVTETTIGNVVIELGGETMTPPITSGLLPGTFRSELLAHDKIVERVVTLDDLAAADAVFMINSLRGWVPLDLVG